MQPFFQAGKHADLGIRPFVGVDEAGVIGVFYHNYNEQENFGPYCDGTDDDLVRSFRGMQLWDLLLPKVDEVKTATILDCWRAGCRQVRDSSIDALLGAGVRELALESKFPSFDAALGYLWENDIPIGADRIYEEVRHGTIDETDVLDEVLSYMLLLIRGELSDDYKKLRATIELRRASYDKRALACYLDGAKRFMATTFPELKDSFRTLVESMPRQHKSTQPESKGLFDTLTRSFRRADLLAEDFSSYYQDISGHRYAASEALQGLARNFETHLQEIHLDMRLLSYHENLIHLAKALDDMRRAANELSRRERIKQAEHAAIRNRLQDLIVYLHVQVMEHMPGIYELAFSPHGHESVAKEAE